MKKTMKTLTTIIFTIALLIGVATPKTIMAAEPTNNARIEYNVPSSFVPYIYTYDRFGGILDKLTNGSTEVTYSSFSMVIYVSKNKATVDTTNSTITVNDMPYDISWSEDANYQIANVSFPQGLGKRAVVKADFVYRGNFGIKARKIATGSNEARLEPLLNATPTTYQLTNDDGSIAINGSANTFNSYSNFVHWNATGSSATYIKATDDTILYNLPDGVYTVKETYAGEGMDTDSSRSSSFPYFNASNLQKDENGFYYYTFEVTSQLINDFLFQNQSNTNFFGFYTLPAKEKYSLTFDANGGTGNMDAITDKIAGDAITLPNNTFEKEHYTFAGWNTVENPTAENPGFPYQDGSNFTFGQESEVLYAQWLKQKAVHHEVNINDGSTGTIVKIEDLSKTLYETNDLAYTSEMLDEIAKTYIKDQNYTNVEYKNYIIQVKESNSEEWTSYVNGMELTDETQIRYMLNVVKNIEILPPVTPEGPIVPNLPVTPATPRLPGIITVNTQPQNVTVVEETVVEQPTPLSDNQIEKVQDNQTPLTNEVGASWALINLICSMLTVISAIVLCFFKRKRANEKDDSDDMKKENNHTNNEEQEELQKRSLWMRVVSVVIAIASVIVFMFTENVLNPMILVDRWTFTMVILLVVQMLTLIIARKWKHIEQVDEEPETMEF